PTTAVGRHHHQVDLVCRHIAGECAGDAAVVVRVCGYRGELDAGQEMVANLCKVGTLVFSAKGMQIGVDDRHALDRDRVAECMHMHEVQHGSAAQCDAACKRERLFAEQRAVERYKQIAVHRSLLSLPGTGLYSSSIASAARPAIKSR